VWAWLQALFQQNAKAYAKCRAYLNLLAEYGHELRRPHAENLGGGIYELRPRLGHVNYRILYFFHGQNIAVLAHALTKEEDIPQIDIERTLKRKEAFEHSPQWHTYERDLPYG